MRGVNLDATRLTAYDEYDGDDEYGSYDEAAFDREYGADLEALEEPYEDEAMDRGAAAAQSMDFGAAAPVNEFRGKFDPPLEPGAGRMPPLTWMTWGLWPVPLRDTGAGGKMFRW